MFKEIFKKELLESDAIGDGDKALEKSIIDYLNKKISKSNWKFNDNKVWNSKLKEVKIFNVESKGDELVVYAVPSKGICTYEWK